MNNTAFLHVLAFGAFVLSVMALKFGFAPPWTTVGADTDADVVNFTDEHLDTMVSTSFVNVPVNITAPRHVARNIVAGRAIRVCTTDYPNAVGEAVSGWNAALKTRSQPFLASNKNAFAASTR